MKFFKVLCIGLGLLISAAGHAQDAKAVLDKLSEKVQSYSSMHVDYNLTIEDDQEGGEVVNQDGSAVIKGEKFALTMDDYHIFCDGETFWTYETESNTCYINDFEEMQEENDISPSDLFTIWEEGFKQEHKGTVSEGGKSYTKINLYPTDSDREFHTITLLIDEGKMEIKKAIIKGRDGQTMTYTINSFNSDKSTTESDFTFKESDYPGCEIEDQRF